MEPALEVPGSLVTKVIITFAFGAVCLAHGYWCLLHPHQIEQIFRAGEDKASPQRRSWLPRRNIVLEARFVGVIALTMSAIAFYVFFALLFK